MGRPRKPDPIKNCRQCGAIMSRKVYKGTLESMLAFSRRVYCNRKCMAASMVQSTVTRSGYAQRARKMMADKTHICSVCGTNENVTVNHINRDWSDNSLENLELVCMSCHMKKHWSEPDRLYDHPKAAVCVICSNPNSRTKNGYCEKHWQRIRKWGHPHMKKLKPFGPVVIVDD